MQIIFIKKGVLIFLLCTCTMVSRAQSEDDLQTPKIVPPSADAVALGKYGQIPVDKSTGIPEISIPIYEIKTPRFSLPISLSYHASGIKVNEISSWVGAGWVLNAGGIITRSMIGFADDDGLGFLTNHYRIKKTADIVWPDDIQYISDVVNKRIDTEPDNFFFNFNSHSGSFVFGEDTKPALTPYQPIKITYDPLIPIYHINNFTVTDENGNTYLFNDKEYVTSSIHNQMSGVSSWYLTQMISADLTDTIKFFYTTDALPQVEVNHNFSQDISDLCDAGFPTVRQIVHTLNTRTYYPVRISSIVFKGGKVDFTTSDGRLDEGNKLLQTIKISQLDYYTNQYNTLKSFNFQTNYFYNNNRDYYHDNVSEKDRHRLKLNGIQELDKNGTVVRTHSFEYNSTVLPPVSSFAQDKWGYYNGHDENKSLLESQQATYYGSGSSAPQIAIIGGDEGANRSVSEPSMKAGVLTKITYPTGGYNVFNYECNKMRTTIHTPVQVQSAGIGAGNQGGSHEVSSVSYTPTNDMLAYGGNIFHVKISDKDGSGLYPQPFVEIKRVSDNYLVYYNDHPTADITAGVSLTVGVEYQIIAEAHGPTGIPNGSTPNAVITTTYNLLSQGVVDMSGLRVKSIQLYNSDGKVADLATYGYGVDGAPGGIPLSILNTDHVSRAAVCTDRSTDINFVTFASVTTYTDNSAYPLSTMSGSCVAYESITVYKGDEAKNLGKTIYRYDIYQDSMMAVFAAYRDGLKIIPVNWKNGGPRWQGIYNNDGFNNYSLVQEISNTYNIIGRKGGTGSIIQILKDPIGPPNSCDYFDDVSIDTRSGAPRVYAGGGMCEWLPSYFFMFDYPISTGNRVLTKTSLIDYSSDGSYIENISEYAYDNLDHVFPTRITTYTSKKESLIQSISYPQDLVRAGDDPTGIYGLMVSKNILATKIETTLSKDQIQLKKIKNNQFFFDSKYVKPQSVETRILDQSNTDTRVVFDKYDRFGNVSQFHKASDGSHSYIWDYWGTKPIAEITNATNDQIAYTSFESDGNGNWTFNSAAVNPANGITGNKSYALSSSNTISKTGLAAGTYIVSYWLKNNSGTATINNYGSILITSHKGWYFYQRTFTNVTSITISGTAVIDEVRLYPADAQMTTYTYTPLVGLTSQCDENNRITYYEYDVLQRLERVRDMDGYLVKQYAYKYDGQLCSNTTSFCTSATISYTNAIVGAYAVNLTNTATGAVLTYNINAATVSGSTTTQSSDSWINIPSGIYNITITPTVAPGQTEIFQVGSLTQQDKSFSASNISVECPASLIINIHN